jgi:hypothetical protein
MGSPLRVYPTIKSRGGSFGNFPVLPGPFRAGTKVNLVLRALAQFSCCPVASWSFILSSYRLYLGIPRYV